MIRAENTMDHLVLCGVQAGVGPGYTLEAAALRLADDIAELRADGGIPPEVHTLITVLPQQRVLEIRVEGLSIDADPGAHLSLTQRESEVLGYLRLIAKKSKSGATLGASTRRRPRISRYRRCFPRRGNQSGHDTSVSMTIIRAGTSKGSDLMRDNIIRAVGGSLIALGVGVATAACGSPTNAAGTANSTSTVSTTPSTTSSVTSSVTGHTPHPALAASGDDTGAAVYVDLYDPQQTMAQKPTELEFYENTEMDGITWSSWGGQTAQGNGTLIDNNCEPDCASGQQEKYSAHIVLSDIQTVNGKPAYTRYTVTFKGQDEHPDLAKALTDQMVKPS